MARPKNDPSTVPDDEAALLVEDPDGEQPTAEVQEDYAATQEVQA